MSTGDVVEELKRYRRQDWKAGLDKATNGSVRANLANALVGLRNAPEWQGVTAYDEFAMRTMVQAPAPWEPRSNAYSPREWRDDDDIRAAEWLQQAGINVSPETAARAVEAVAYEHSFHPVRDYLDALEWDGLERLPTWAVRHLGAEDCEYTRAVSERFLIAAVARVMAPGCKADAVPILEGKQGIGKSRALETLAAPWFTDEIADLGSKDAAQQVQGVWLLELSELDAMTRREAGTVKAFVSRHTDRFRPAYGRRVITVPRQCVFAGTTNSDSYLRDETGNRRFWPIRCERIDLEALAEERDQLWAEAVEAYHSGRGWWLESAKLMEAARGAQQQRLVTDVWHERIEGYVKGRQRVSVDEVLENLGIPLERRDQIAQNRLARTLKTLGMERKRGRWGAGDQLVWRYVFPD